MTSKRRILLDALDAWRAEGALDEGAWRFLRSRYENAPKNADLDAILAPARDAATPAGAVTTPAATASEASAPPAGASAAAVGASDISASPGTAFARTSARLSDLERRPRSFAADAMQFVGGLLVGAGLVALVLYLDVPEGDAPWWMAGLGALLGAAATFGALRAAPSGLVEAGMAGALVPLTVGAGGAIAHDDVTLPSLVALASVGVLVLRRGAGPSALTAAAAFAFTSAAATVLQEGIFGDEDPVARWLWFATLLGFGALLLVRRERAWIGATLGLYVVPLAIGCGLVLDLVPDLTSVGMELGLGAFLGALFALGLAWGVRGLVAGAVAGLTVDAVTFAFDVGGPGTAVVVLLALGGLLVWQAELVRSYFRRAA